MSEIIEIEKRVDAICESLESQKFEFEEAAKLCVEAVQGLHLRMERIEKWILESRGKKRQ